MRIGTEPLDLGLTLKDSAQCFHWIERDGRFGAVVAGLSSAAGLGILALLRGRRGVKTYAAILAACYVAAALAGTILQLFE